VVRNFGRAWLVGDKHRIGLSLDIAKTVRCLGFDQVLGARRGDAVVSNRDSLFRCGTKDADRQGRLGNGYM
jgi:hypothetical protein